MSYNSLDDEELVVLANRGDREATEMLLARLRPMLDRISRRLYISGTEREDLVQEGFIALCRAITEFKVERLPKFRPFAELCVERRLRTAIRRSHGPRMAVLNNALPLMAHSEQCESGPKTTMIAGLSILDFERVLEEARLTELERQALFGSAIGLTYHEVSVKLGCHRKRVDNALQRAKRKIASGLPR